LEGTGSKFPVEGKSWTF